jgi:cytochrome c oxidase subunit II
VDPSVGRAGSPPETRRTRGWVHGSAPPTYRRPPGCEYNPRALARTPATGRSRRLAFAVLLALAALLAFSGAAFADAITPESGGSPNADEIDSLYKLILVVAVVIFVGVEGALFYSLFKFRARKGLVAAQIRGNTRLEIGWTVGAALILVVLAAITFVKLGDIRNPPNSGPNGLQLADTQLFASGPTKKFPPNGKALNVCVNGQQYVWRYTYANDCDNAPLSSPFSYQEMVVPVETTVTLDINAQDVAHSWWIPKLGGKFDAVPGYTNHTWFKIPAKYAGKVFTGQCAELCGRNHANMTAEVRAVTPSEYEKWLDQRKADIKAADQAAEQQRKQVEQTP